jgi:hypothetical protein
MCNLITIQMKITIISILLALISCNGQQDKVENTKNVIEHTHDNFEVSDVSNYSHIQETNSYEEPEDPESKETRIRFKNFTLVIHDFKGYEIVTSDINESEDEIKDRTYWGHYGGHSDLKQAILNDNEIDNEDYKETLISLKDTLHLSESLVMGGNDNRIWPTTLFQIIPNNSQDRFMVSYRYLSYLNDIKEQTPLYTLKDSAQYFFRALPHSSNTQEEFDWVQYHYSKELDRIKKKYNLRDTLVVIPGEYNTELTLTNGNELFSYGYESYLFQIECYNNNKLIEKKYVVIYIAYGC